MHVATSISDRPRLSMRPRRQYVWTSLVAISVIGLGTAIRAQEPARAKGKAAAKVKGQYDAPAKVAPTPEQVAKIKAETESLAKAIAGLKSARPGDDPLSRDLNADVAALHKAAVWLIRHDEFYTKSDPGAALKALVKGLERAKLLADGKHPWTTSPGGTVRGYVSKVDGSVQPYAIYVPKDLDLNEPARLDVVLHGRGATLHEVRFFDQHEGKPNPADAKGLTLHVFGRTNNAYRWAGEADVFEAIDAVKRNYRVDEKRVVLRGFSMGGAGAWHLGLHHPDRWVSVEAGAGFAETLNYAKLKNPPEYVLKGLHVYDAADYSLNAFNVPMAGYGGELDPQKASSELIEKNLAALGFKMKPDGLVTKAEGLDFQRIVGKDMGHKVDPASADLLKTFHNERAEKGIDTTPKHIRFITYTLKYPKAHWLSIARLRRHYDRTEVDAELNPDDDSVTIRKADNVAVLALARPVAETLKVGNQTFPLRQAAEGRLPMVYFRKVQEGWEPLDFEASRAIEENARKEKAPGLQGPIDDAFSGAFLCVRPTGTAQNPEATKWAVARLERFAKEWSKWMRGDLPIKDDRDVTPADIAEKHLIAFGDPGSNSLLNKVSADLPVSWTGKELAFRTGPDLKADAASHAPAFITLNPLNPGKYLVVNSGHTFGAREFAGTNALLYPHLGDYALFRVGDKEELKNSGYFDERWRRP